MGFFEIQQDLFDLHPVPKTTKVSGALNDSMTGNDQREGIMSIGHSDSSKGHWMAYSLGHLFVGSSLTIRNLF